MLYGNISQVIGVLESIPMEVDGAKMPFALTFIHNKKLLQDKLQEYGNKQLAILDEYAIKDEEGKFVYKEVDGVRQEGQPSNLSDFDVEDVDGLNRKWFELAKEDAGVEFKKINVNTLYYLHKADMKVPHEEYINQFLSAEQITVLMQLGMFEV